MLQMNRKYVFYSATQYNSWVHNLIEVKCSIKPLASWCPTMLFGVGPIYLKKLIVKLGPISGIFHLQQFKD